MNKIIYSLNTHFKAYKKANLSNFNYVTTFIIRRKIQRQIEVIY